MYSFNIPQCSAGFHAHTDAAPCGISDSDTQGTQGWPVKFNALKAGMSTFSVGNPEKC
ncbi:hypothetical protein Patl1_11917 [Pistacia atlantica]|uniref:Uncharacterized protein n=1 Tax=Pistacia atlantica TaxID=434234 RepID=A0ACC1A4L4_9ROSI|nr:hypothetical protein Patl1_11917 [Pistacia atlantica]